MKLRVRSLRSSLVLSMVALAAAGLLATCATAAVALRSYLLQKTDDQLAAAAVLVRQRAAFLAPEGPELRSVVSVTEYLIEFRRADGHTVRFESGSPLPPDPLLDRADLTVTATQTVTCAVGERYRVVVIPLADGSRVLVGLPLAPVRNTVVRFVVIATLTGAAVLILLSLLARWLVIRRLRPLDEIAATATAIAAGDLDRRVGAAPAHTEVGRLSTAVDRMLARIQAAMTARERSEERMRTFVADASHELRTPVTSISGYLQLVRSGVIDLGQRPDVLRRIEEEAARMGVLVGELLYLARLDADPPTRREPVDLAALIQDAVANAQAIEPTRPLTITLPTAFRIDARTGPSADAESGARTELSADADSTELQPLKAPDTLEPLEVPDGLESLEVPGDADTVRRVLANLLGNVRSHTPPGTKAQVKLTVNEDRIRVAVSDEGPGMSAAEVKHAFERFWRADESRARSDGAGLGLAIVAEAIRAHRGEVGIESAAGVGTTVWFELPRS